jgi:hypothetical protein
MLLLVFLINTLVVAVVVIVHYECLRLLSKLIIVVKIKPRLRIVFGVFGALIAHAVEVWIFAFAYYAMINLDGWGQLSGNIDGSLLDCVYFSFTVFSTVGFGDIVPLGHLRYLTGIESLTGLVLITWSASFLYYEMQKYWHKA